MLERLIGFSLRNKPMVFGLIVLVGALGTMAVFRMPVDAFPDVTNNQVEIIGEGKGMSALEIERFVTHPMEMALRGIPHVIEMRSITKFGLTVITIVFKDDVDVYFARQLVFERIAEVSEKMPEGVRISMGPVATAMGDIYQYTLEGRIPDNPEATVRYLTELRTLQDWVVTPLLKNVAGVSEVNSFGGYLKQFDVVVSPEKLLQYDLRIRDVFDAIQENNQNVGGSGIDRDAQQYIVRGIGLLRSVDDIRAIVLESHEGVPVLVGDVADVRMGHAIRQGAALIDGEREAVGGIVMMLRGENSREVVKRVIAEVNEINENHVLPGGITIRPYYNRLGIVGSSISTITEALFQGAGLVLLVLFLFLGNLRGALVVLLALPLSLLLTFTVMGRIGLEANLMSLGGLAISIGMIIDATIIQVENVQRHMSRSGNPDRKLSTVLKAVLEVRKPSIFGELIIATTFLPILALQGLEGKMFIPLALTVIIALLSSLLLSIFVIPVLCLVFLKPGTEKESLILRVAKRLYLPLLDRCMRKKLIPLAVALVLFAATLLVLPRLGTEFIPIMDEGAFDMDIQMMPGVSLTKAMETSLAVERTLKTFPEIETVVGRTGQTGIALEARGIDKTGYVGSFKPRSEWKTAETKAEIIDSMRKALDDIPGMAFGFSQPIQCRIDELVAGTRAQLILKLFGEDSDVLKRKIDEIAGVFSTIRGTADLVVEQVAGQPYLSIAVDRGRIARYGFSVNEVLEVVEIAIGGKTSTQLFEENRFFDVVVRFPDDVRNSIGDIGRIFVTSRSGYRVPLDQLARIELVEGPVQISRQNGQRRIGIEINIRNRDIGSFVSEAKAEIKNHVDLPPGYTTAWGGQFENQQRAMKRLSVIAPVAVALIFLLLFVTFHSARLAFLVFFNLPFALIGGVFALFIGGLYLSVPASVGFIVLFGVAVLNGVVLVSTIAQLRQDGIPLEEALKMGCRNRLRPVLMTASISIFGLIPLLFATGPGSEIQRPLAVVVIGGLVTSTLLTLLVLPTLYAWFEKH